MLLTLYVLRSRRVGLRYSSFTFSASNSKYQVLLAADCQCSGDVTQDVALVADRSPKSKAEVYNTITYTVTPVTGCITCTCSMATIKVNEAYV
jgi:hypothetical protein